MQSIISDDQFYARSVSNLARLQNRQTRSKIGPNSGPLGQMMTTQPSAHQVVLHMVRKKWRKLFYSNGNLTNLCILTKCSSSYMVHEPNQVTQCKILSKSTFEKIPKGTYPFTKHPIGQDNDNVEHTESEGSFLATS